MFTLKLYRVSADNGKKWTTQWLTDDEAAECTEKYGYICKVIPGHMKQI